MSLRKKFIFWQNKAKDSDFIEDMKLNPQLKQLIKYDDNFNNKRKVIFESLLASIIRNQPRMLKNVVQKVAYSILPDFKKTFESLKNNTVDSDVRWLYEHFYNFFATNDDIQAEYTGNFGQKIEDKEHENFINWIYSILASNDSSMFYRQLLLIREYGSFYIKPYAHLPQFKHLNNGNGMQIIPPGLGDTLVKEQMQYLWYKSRENWPKNNTEHSRISTPHRSEITSRFGIISQNEFKEMQLSIPNISPHIPGGSLWRVITTSEFAQHARHALDMPLISGQSGSIALMLIPAMVIAKLDAEELRYFNLCCISYLIGNGHHTLHECKFVWKAFDIPYKDGDYSSIFPPQLLIEHPELLGLLNKFSDLLFTEKEVKLKNSSW